jgi:hypothetical protein
MGKPLYDKNSQMIANWLSSDLETNLPIYTNLCKEIFKEKGIELGVFIQRNDNYIYFYGKEDLSGMLMSIVDVNESNKLITDDNDGYRFGTPKEIIEMFCKVGNYELPTMFEGVMHEFLSDKIGDTLLSYDYIVSHIRDNKINEIIK